MNELGYTLIGFVIGLYWFDILELITRIIFGKKEVKKKLTRISNYKGISKFKYFVKKQTKE